MTAFGGRLHHLDLNDVGLFRMETEHLDRRLLSAGPGAGWPRPASPPLVHSFLISTSASLALRSPTLCFSTRCGPPSHLRDLRVMTTLTAPFLGHHGPTCGPRSSASSSCMHPCPRRSRPCHSELVRRPTSQQLYSACRELETSVRLTSVRLSSTASGRRRSTRGTGWASRVAVAL